MRKLRLKVGFIVVVLLLFVIGFIAVSFENLIATVFTSNRLDQLEKQAIVYSNRFQKTNINFNTLKVSVSGRQGLIYINTQGQILYQVGQNPFSISSYNVPGVDRVLHGHTSIVKTSDPPFKESMYIVGVPVAKPNQGGVFLLEPTIDGDKILTTVSHELELAVLGALLLAFAGALLLLDRTVSPLITMEKIANAIIEGDYTKKISIDKRGEISNLGKAINQLADHLKHQEETRAKFLSNLSHEIRTPLTYIQGYTQILEEEIPQSAEERKKYLSIMQKELKRLRKLLDDLMDIGRLKEPTFKMNFEQIDLVPVIYHTLETLKPYADQNRVLLHYEGSKFLPKVFVDPVRIKQVLINLVHNALQYSNPDTNVTVRAEFSNGQIKVEVCDHGPGIPAHEIPHIWERFYRVDPSRNRSSGGTGLGLSIVKQIIDAHKGKVEVASEVGKGTTISFVLPKAAHLLELEKK